MDFFQAEGKKKCTDIFDLTMCLDGPWNSVPVSPRMGSGLINAGNLCYSNALLQSLASIPVLQSWLHLLMTHPNKQGLVSLWSSADRDWMLFFWNAVYMLWNQGTTIPRASDTLLERHLKHSKTSLSDINRQEFSTWKQSDSHEYFHTIMDIVEKREISALQTLGQNANQMFFCPTDLPLKSTPGILACPLACLFEFGIRSHLSCITCGTTSTCDAWTNLLQCYLMQRTENQKTSVFEDVVNTMFQPAEVEARCEICSGKSQDDVPKLKKIEIVSFPHILILQLSDYAYDMHQTAPLESVPEFLSFFPQGRVAYQLCSTINKIGGQVSGHYISFNRHFVDAKVWDKVSFFLAE